MNKEIKEEPKKCMYSKDDYTDEDRKVLCGDCEEECEFNKKEEPVSEELEEACEQLAENARKHKAETSSPFFSQEDYKQGVMAGAKWQKEQMMKNIIDAQCFGFQGAALFSFRLPADNYLVGSKVKIIIIKDN